MRIISQNKRSDINYDLYDLRATKDGEVNAISPTTNEFHCPLGKYKSEEKALKVMEIIRKQYSRYNSFFILNSQGIPFEKRDEYGSVEYTDAYEKILQDDILFFYMPKDEEVKL